MRKIIMVAVALALASSVAMAAEKKMSSGGGYKKMRYGMSGCGVPSIFIEKNEMLPQIGASLISAFFTGSTDTMAMTSGTSNCTHDASMGAVRMEQEVFVRANLSSLSREAAQGSGDHLSALAEVLGCGSEPFARLSRVQYSEIYSGDARSIIENYRSAIASDPDLKGSCERVI